MLVCDVTERFPIPHEPGEWVELRQLGYIALQKCAAPKEQEALAKARALGAEFLQTVEQLSAADRAKVDAASGDAVKAAEYDQAAMLVASISAWSYGEPPTAENIARLDKRTADFIFERCLALYEKDESDRVKASSPSTSPSME